MIKPENFRAENFLCRIFFGLKISRSDFLGVKNLKSGFFWMRNFFVRKFLGHKDCAAGKMVGLMDCRLPFLDNNYEIYEIWRAESDIFQSVIKKYDRKNPPLGSFKRVAKKILGE